MDVRKATWSDNVLPLWNESFGDDNDFTEHYFKHFYNPEYNLVYEDKGQLFAMVQALPYTLLVHGREIPATYIYGACTAQAARKQGLMRGLLEESFRLDRLAGREASFLIPAEPWLFDFYAKFGYQKGLYYKKSDFSGQIDGRYGLRRLSQRDIPAMMALYESLGNRVARDAEYFSGQLGLFSDLSQGAFGLFSGEELVAYGFPWVQEDTIFLQELFCKAMSQGVALTAALGKRFEKNQITSQNPHFGQQVDFGVVRWHEKNIENPQIYMNLMFN